MLAVKIITGFRKDQEYTIDAEEAHKAYFLFMHKEQSGIFSNGVAIDGSTVKGIVPDYHTSMGWNPEIKIGPDDMNQIMNSGVGRRLQNVLKAAKEVASLENQEALNMKLKDARNKFLLGMPDSKAITAKSTASHRELEDYKRKKLGRTPLHVNHKLK